MSSNIKTVCCVPGAHFDLGWCGTPQACLCRGDRIILSAIQAITGDYSDYRFTVEYAMFMDHFLCSYPEYSSMVKRLAQEGKLEVACSWSGMINQILPGEAIIRDITRAKRWIQSVLGIESRLVQFTDIPGHTQQLPQILTKLGIDFMIYSRYHPPTLVHRFRAPSGDEVLACNHPNHYDWAVFSLRRGYEYFSRHFRDEVERIGHLWPDETLLMGDEGDLKGPDPGIIETIQTWNRENLDMQIEITTASEFMERLSMSSLPVYQGEMPYGFATIPAFEEETYRWATKGVNQLISGEKFSVLREVLGLGKFDWKAFERGWKAISYPHDHNIGGKHGEVNDRVRTHKAIEAYEVGDAAVQGACATIAENVRLMADGLPLVVFNPLSWIRTDVVQVYAEFQGRDVKSVIVKDHTGCIMPSQVESIDMFPLPENDTGDYTSSTRVYFAFEARNVPSIGYKTFYVYPDYDEDGLHYSFKHDTALIENGMYRITFNSAGIDSVYWKAGDKEIVRKCGQGFAQLMIVEDTAEDINQLLTGTEWYSSLDLDSLEVVERGAVRSIVRVPGKVGNTHFSMDVALYENLDYSMFPLRFCGMESVIDRLEWYSHLISRGQMLYMVVPLGLYHI